MTTMEIADSFEGPEGQDSDGQFGDLKKTHVVPDTYYLTRRRDLAAWAAVSFSLLLQPLAKYRGSERFMVENAGHDHPYQSLVNLLRTSKTSIQRWRTPRNKQHNPLKTRAN